MKIKNEQFYYILSAYIEITGIKTEIRWYEALFFWYMSKDTIDLLIYGKGSEMWMLYEQMDILSVMYEM